MVSLGGVFDANAAENQGKNSVLPAGEYEVVAITSEVKQTNDRTGSYLNVQFQVTKGEFQNRRIFKKFNLWLAPEKDKAIAIARGQFSDFCKATGVLSPQDSSELHNIPLVIKVTVQTSAGYGDQNEIARFVKKTSGDPVVQPAASGGW
jgi:hypothetical protein